MKLQIPAPSEAAQAAAEAAEIVALVNSFTPIKAGITASILFHTARREQRVRTAQVAKPKTERQEPAARLLGAVHSVSSQTPVPVALEARLARP